MTLSLLWRSETYGHSIVLSSFILRYLYICTYYIITILPILFYIIDLLPQYYLWGQNIVSINHQ